jgi:hypothetical protein
MKFLRATLGLTRQDRLTNEAIRKIVKASGSKDTIINTETISLTVLHLTIAVLFHCKFHHLNLLEGEV